MKSLEACIERFLIGVHSRKLVDYGNAASVRKSNAEYDTCFRQLKYIDKYYPDRIDDLIQLLNHPDVDVIAHCAPMILRLKNSTPEHKEKALHAIRNLIQDERLDDVRRFGFSISIKKWEKELAECMTGSRTGDGDVS